MIIIEDFNSKLLKIDKKPYKNIDIYYTGYITIQEKVLVTGMRFDKIYDKTGE